MYNKKEELNNIVYSVDMLRLKTYIQYNIFNDISFYLETYCNNKIKNFWISDRIMCFKYNYVIEIDEGLSFFLGFHHNNEKKDEHKGQYNLTVEFNPNKIKDNSILMFILNKSGDWCIKSFDIAMDIKINICDLITDITGRSFERVENRGFDNKTVYIGKGDGRVKIYNKKRESNLDIFGDLTRIEISRDVEDFEIRKAVCYKYDNVFPNIYINNYVYSLKDYEDKTLLAILYAVQNGFPIRCLTRVYKSKIKNLLEGGNKIRFDGLCVTKLIRQTIYFYFINNKKVVWW